MIATTSGVPIVPPAPTQQVSTDDVVPRIKSLKLPSIDLPKFNGDPLQWETFRDIFKSMVHNEPQYDKIRKFFHLQSCLTGEAAGVIKNSGPTEAGYDTAWNDLEDRYGNPRIISFCHI